MSDQEFADEVLIPELHSHDLEPAGECLHEAAWYDLLAAALKPRRASKGAKILARF